MTTRREVVESPRRQGIEEEQIYSVTTTPWGSTPTSVDVKAFDMSNGALDVSGTVLVGSPAVAGDVITLPKVKSLTLNHTYRIEIKFTSGGQIFEPFLIVIAE